MILCSLFFIVIFYYILGWQRRALWCGWSWLGSGRDIPRAQRTPSTHPYSAVDPGHQYCTSLSTTTAYVHVYIMDTFINNYNYMCTMYMYKQMCQDFIFGGGGWRNSRPPPSVTDIHATDEVQNTYIRASKELLATCVNANAIQYTLYTCQ